MSLPNNQSELIEASVSVHEIPGIVSNIRDSFNSDKSLSREWRLSQLHALDRLLTENNDEICDSLMKDLRKDSFQAFIQEIALIRQDIYDAVKHLDEWMSDEVVSSGLLSIPSQSMIQKEPLGVVLVFGAWNYNVLLSLQPLVGAIAAGNCVILKPGSFSINTSNTLVRLVNKYMDTECIFALEGDSCISQALLKEKYDKIFFTGSKFVGRVVAEAAAKYLTPTVLELGGKSPCIVDETADLKISAQRFTWGAFMNCGQTCIRPDYLLIHEDVADELIKNIIQAIETFYGNNPKTSQFFGRLINDGAFNRLKNCMEGDAKYLVHGGAVDPDTRYIEPSIFDFGTDFDAFSSSQLMSGEVFGPVVPVFRYKDLDTQVLPYIRSKDKPLSLYMFTNNSNSSDRVIRLTSSGAAVVNDVVIHAANPNLPFGGVGESGMGNYHGKHSFACFSHHKAVVKRPFMADGAIRYPPYSDSDQLIVSTALNPAISYYYGQATSVVTDKKNIAIALMGGLLLKNAFTSRL